MKRLAYILLPIILFFCLYFSCFANGAGSTITDIPAYFKDSVSFYNQSDERVDNDTIQIRFEEKSGTLFLEGSGRITEFFPRFWEDGSEPFLSNQTIRQIVVREGISGIENSFNDCFGLESIILPSTMEEISRSFVGCGKLRTIQIEKGLQKIDACSFYQCPNLTQFQLDETPLSIDAFFDRFAPADWKENRAGYLPPDTPDSFIDPEDVAGLDSIIKKPVPYPIWIAAAFLLLLLGGTAFWLIRKHKTK